MSWIFYQATHNSYRYHATNRRIQDLVQAWEGASRTTLNLINQLCHTARPRVRSSQRAYCPRWQVACFKKRMSVEELIEEGQSVEADAISGVEDAPDADMAGVQTKQVPEDEILPNIWRVIRFTRQLL